MAQGKQRRGRAARSTFKQSTLKSILSPSQGARGSFSTLLRMEPLEDRRMLATYVVNNLGDLDNGGNVVVGSLRQAVQLSNSTPDVTDTIVFADFLFTNQSTGSSSPGTIFLDGRANGGVLNITDQVEILGPGAGVLTINGTAGQRIFDINIDAENQFRNVTIGGMTLSGGSLFSGDGRGGAISNRENLLLVETEVSGNSAADGGGGIYQPFGSLTVQNSLILNNTSGGGGGGIFAGSEDGELGSLVTVTNSTIAQNQTFSIVDHPGFGGGIFTRRGTVDIQHSTITENTAYRGGGVASYGRAVDEEGPIPTTNLTHTIAYGNTAGGEDEDLAAIYFDIEGEPLIPDLNILDYNIIGTVGGGTVAGSSEAGNFYLVIAAPEGISWTDANAIATSGTGHLATITSSEENQVVFDLIDEQRFWKLFEPEDDDARPAQNIGPWIGGIQTDEENGPADGWEWVQPDDQSPFVGIWDPGQPDDGLATSSDDPPELPENRLAYHAPDDTRNATWGDYVDDPEDEFKPIAFVIEYDQGTNFFGVDPVLRPLDYYGGSTRAYYPNSIIDPMDPDFMEISPAIDAGNPELEPTGSDQRGRHFVRWAGGFDPDVPVIDIGAVEVQRGVFVVDALEDENDGQYTRVWDTFPTPDAPVLPNGINVETYDYTSPGDFSLREALEFSNLNPEIDTIRFSQQLVNASSNRDLTASDEPTILLRLGQLTVLNTVNIEGPQSFILEIDANDPTPTFDNNDGHRVFAVASGIDVYMSNMTLLGGDQLGLGGAILNYSNLTLERMTLKNNAAGLNGGGLHHDTGTLTILSSTISGNVSAVDGGGVYIATTSGTAAFVNTTISGNESGNRGAGVFNRGSDTLIRHATITANESAATRGSGLWNHTGGNVEVYSSIIAGNYISDVAGQAAAITGITTGGYNVVGVGTAQFQFSGPGDQDGILDPRLAPLAYNGGLTQVHVLLTGSLALDTGDPNFDPNGPDGVPETVDDLVNDQRGVPYARVYDADSNGTARIDVGAYELQGNTYIVDAIDDLDDGNYSTGFLSLREAVNLANFSPLEDFITFDSALLGQVILAGLLPITDVVTITGLGSQALSIVSSSANELVFQIDNNIAAIIDVTITDLALQAARISSKENLDLTRLIITGIGLPPFTATSGPAITQVGGSLDISESTITGNSALNSGSAINAQDTDVTIYYSTFASNSTSASNGHGGGLFLKNSSLVVDYSVIVNSQATGGSARGGGIHIDNTGLTLSNPRNNLTITNNSIISGNLTAGSNAEGGGIFAKNTNVVINGGTVLANNRTTGTSSDGGAVYLSGGTLSVSEATFSTNRTTGNSSTGGAVSNNGATVTITDATFLGNSTSGSNAHGGAIHNLNGFMTIQSSALVQNSTTGTNSKGGGLSSNTNLTGQHTTIVNSTISGNSTKSYGGGVYNADGLTTIKHSTFTLNSAPYLGFGAGVATFGSEATTRTDVGSSIIAGNTFNVVMEGNQSSDVDRVGGTFQDTFNSLGYNVIGTGLTIKFNATGDRFGVLDPKLEKLSLNGGKTLNHALKEGSLAINGGNPSALAGQNGVPEFDQRGKDRVYNQGAGGRIDIGAFESSLSPSVSGDFNNDGVINGRDFLAWQRGQSPTPGSSGDLADWQSNYGTGGGTLVAALVVEEFSESVSAPLVAEEPASEPSFASSEPILTGWILQAPVSSNPSSTFTEAEVDVAYLAAGSELDDYILAAAEDDFGDIVTSRSLDDDSDELSAEDAVFELIGAGEL